MMTTQEIANRLVELCRANQQQQAVEELYAENFVSLEAEGAPNQRSVGHAAHVEKGKNFEAMIANMNAVTWTDPIVAENFFTLGLYMNVDMTNGAKDVNMDEVCVYQVKEGKIVQEQFFYTVQPAPAE
ncbi:MAG: SnoaL-like domain-containing protein [Aureispira sp.]